MTNALQTMGDAGVPNTDVSYTGETGESMFSAQYYINKAREFQNIMDSLDETARAIRVLLDSGVSEDDADELQMWLQEFNAKKSLFRGTAEAINAGAYVINSVGGRFPVMQVPQTLGLAPVIPLAAIAALATAATLIVWARDWMAGVNQRLRDKNLLAEIEDPEQRAVAARAMLDAAAANDRAKDSPMASIANVVKWGAFAALAYMGYRMWQNR
jgi:hypothetical protein